MAQSQSWWSRPSSEEPSEPLTSFESKPLEGIDVFDSENLFTRRVHILGLGSIALLIAHSLRCLPNPPPISLMFHKDRYYEQFKRNGRVVRLISPKSEINDEQTGFDVDLLNDYPVPKNPRWKFIPDAPDRGPAINPIEENERMPSGELYIYSLIVTVKGPATVDALRSVKHRVNEKTTICLMQNGMGQIDELNQKVFTDPQTRPTYMLGIISHGAYTSDILTVVHAGFGTVALGIFRDPDKYPLPPKSSSRNISELSEDERQRYYPTDKELFSSLSSRYLLRTLTRSPVLACAVFPYLDLLQLQLEKLSTNAVMNPLTALLNFPNGDLLDNPPLSTVQRLLVAETSLVIRGLPELDGIPNVRMRFSAKRLEHLLLGVIQRTAKNSSSMREDVRKAKSTEVDYINGYIVRRGEEQGIKCALHFMLMQMVKGKTFSQHGEQETALPFGTSQIEGAAHQGVVTLTDRGSF